MVHMRVLNQKDQSSLYAWLMRAPLYNLFIIGDVETMALGAEDLVYWGQLETDLPAPAWPTRRATAADADALGQLYATAGHMRRDADDVRRLMLQDGRRYRAMTRYRNWSLAIPGETGFFR